MAAVKDTYVEEYANEEDSLLANSRDVDTPIDDDTSDGGALAWLQIAGSFCIMLSTW